MNKTEIGRRLRKFRGALTQTAVADAIGISQSALAMYELGMRVPRDEIKARLAHFYGVTVQELFFSAEA